MAIAIYARVSDDKLKDDGDRRQDVDRQVDKLIKTFNLKNPSIFKDDGISAFKDDYNSRPAFCKLLREIRANRVTQVYVENLDRWSRRVDDGLKTLKEVSLKGCTITSSMEGEIDITTAQGWFRSCMGFMFAEWASRTQSEKVRSGMDRRLNDKSKICHTCMVVHLGRHPSSCGCPSCRKKGR